MQQEIQQFNDLLNEKFDGRLRARWSNQRNEVQIEQRVARGMINFPTPGNDDELIRLRDGYFYVMSVRNGTKMPCPKQCGTDLNVPVREIRELSCPTCKAKGIEHRVSAGFYPLDDRLVEYLQMIDPLRGASKELRNKINKYNENFTEGQRKKVLAQAEAAMLDDFNKLAGIPSVGYTGKELK